MSRLALAGKGLMLKMRSVLYVVILIALALVVSCSETDTDAPSDRNVHPSSWVGPAAANNHGDAVSRSGDESCKICHGMDLNGSGVIPGCSECHFDALGSRTPGGVGWVHGAVLHSQFVAHNETCNKCHDTYRRYGLPPAGCHDCHAGVAPHPTGKDWLDKKSPIFHGIDAKRDLVQCAACHGGNYRGGTSGVSCFRCHFTPTGSRVPNGVAWIHGTTSHSALTSSATVCNWCHVVNRNYGNAPSSCHDCHGAAAPHGTGSSWLLPGAHAQQSIDNRSSCLGCHDLQAGGSGTPPACQACHKQGNPPLAIGICTSCHSRAPDTGEHGEHRSAGCNTCHDGFGTGSLAHYYPNPSPPADVKFRFSNAGDNVTYNGARCSGTCHLGGDEEDHESSRW